MNAMTGGVEGMTFHAVNSVDTVMEHGTEQVERNINATFERGFKPFVVQDMRSKNLPIALAAGGPSLNQTVDVLKRMPVIAACGSAHDHLVNAGIRLDYAVFCDPDPICLKFLKKPQRDCKYLLSSSCDPSMFEALKGFDVEVWHNGGGVENEVYRGEMIVAGGCTVTLRAISLAILMGFYDIHFFGFDSSFEDDHHAYDFTHEGRDIETSPVRYAQVQGGRVFKTNSAWLAQASHFQESVKNFGQLFNPTVHGDGLIAEMMKQATMMAKEKQNGL